MPRPDHVVVVVEENHSADEIIGNADAPFINSLAGSGANFTASYALTHPSQPNYIALFSGSTQGVTDDSCPLTLTAPSLGDEVLGAGMQFTGYSESLPSVGYTGCFSGGYARKHSPWAAFPSLPATANQPLTAFPSDYSTLPQVSFVIPNMQDDMHDGTVAQGDAWLQSNLGGYIAWAQQHNSLFVLTFDEDDTSASNHIATIFTGQQVAPGTYGEQINHLNVLRTITDAFGLAPLGLTATSNPITDVWTGNRPPLAAFTPACTSLTCSFDGTGSVDDGSITAFAWDFGDGGTGTGSTAAHNYSNAGQYSVSLTVTDDQGATATVTHAVWVNTTQPFVQDTFNRTVTGGLGTADLGGPWATTGSASAFSVANGRAAIALASAGAQPSAYLPAVTRTEADVRVRLALSAVPIGGPVNLSVLGRRVSAGTYYSARVVINPDRTVAVQLVRNVSGTQTVLATSGRLSGLAYSSGMQLDVRFQAAGTPTTQLQARVWPTGGAEPTTWQASVSDSSAALQQPGAVGLIGYLSSAATNAPLTLYAGDLLGQPLGATNAAPVAAFMSSCSELVCSFDGSGSTDPDGTLSSWSWSFGDGATGIGSAVQHAYVLPGTYSVSLTVTDGQGAVNTVVHQVSATAPVPNQPPVAAFTSVCSGLTCTFDGSGSSDDEGVTGWSWGFGDGGTGTGMTVSHSYPVAGSYNVTLTVEDADAASGQTSHQVTVSAPSTAFVLDTFNRTVTGGLGAADVGGAWTAVGASYLAVSPGAATARLPKGAQAGGYLPGQLRSDADVFTTVAVNVVPTGGPVTFTVQGRRVSAGNEYSAKLLLNVDRSVGIRVIRQAGGVETTVAGPVRVPGLTYAAGTTLAVRLQVTGTAPTTVRARVWLATAAEPTGWQVSGTDATSGLQTSGAVGFRAYTDPAVTNGPVAVSVGRFEARPSSG